MIFFNQILSFVPKFNLSPPLHHLIEYVNIEFIHNFLFLYTTAVVPLLFLKCSLCSSLEINWTSSSFSFVVVLFLWKKTTRVYLHFFSSHWRALGGFFGGSVAEKNGKTWYKMLSNAYFLSISHCFCSLQCSPGIYLLRGGLCVVLLLITFMMMTMVRLAGPISKA